MINIITTFYINEIKWASIPVIINSESSGYMKLRSEFSQTIFCIVEKQSFLTGS